MKGFTSLLALITAQVYCCETNREKSNSVSEGGMFMTQMQVSYWKNQEDKRSHQAQEAETRRSNLAQEQEKFRSNKEIERLRNLEREEETRANYAREAIQRASLEEQKAQNQRLLTLGYTTAALNLAGDIAGDVTKAYTSTQSKKGGSSYGSQTARDLSETKH